jgi:uncharacterized protein YkwD
MVFSLRNAKLYTVGMALLLISFSILPIIVISARADESKTVLSDTELQNLRQLIFDKTNVERSKAGFKNLILTTDLTRVSQQHTKNMCEKNIFQHESNKLPEGWRTLIDRMKIVQVNSGAENIALRTFDKPEYWSSAIVKGWMESKGHKKNILNPEFKYIGLGILPCGKNIVYATQFFSSEPGQFTSRAGR